MQQYLGSPTASFAGGAGGQLVKDDKENAGLTFCISIHRICDSHLTQLILAVE